MKVETNERGAERHVGLIGLGLVGTALASRLMRAGYSVTGFDVSAEAVDRFEAAGGRRAGAADEVAARCGVTILSLPDGEIARRVVNEIVPAVRPGALVIDTTTAAPVEVEEAGMLLAKVGAGYLDATLSGSSEVIAAGMATWLVGGSKEDFDAAEAIFTAIGGQVFHLGPVGAGARAKLVTNLILGLNRAALAEGLALAEAWGMELPAMLEAAKASAAYSKAMDAKGAKMIAAEYRPQARLKQHHKDVRLMLEAARAAGAALPMSELHARLLAEAEAAGWAEADNAAIIEVWRARRGGGKPA